ncbi:MAG: hypothetical protein WA693_07710 [Pseudolabrys sp.]
MARDGATIFSDLIGVAENTIEGVAENQKSESASSETGCGGNFLKPLRVLTQSPKLSGAFVSGAPPECVGML